ncbi:MAG: helix-turn-helix transcriptional regulator [Flavobacteriales bacterium]|nr:helix-turn-helix transcriptional regulator [Flavobacteriales bacterium]
MSKEALDFLDEIIGEDFTFGSMIKNIRLTDYDNMTQKDFASMLQLSIGRLSDIENDRKPTSIKKAIELAKQLEQSKRFFVATVIQDMLNNNKLNYRVDLQTAN